MGSNIHLSNPPNNNEKKIFEHLFHMLYPRLCSFAFHFVQNDAAAEDIVSDVMYKLWEKKGQFDSLINIKSYLYTSVRNKSLSYLNKKETDRKHINEIKNSWSEEFFQDHLIKEELTGLLFQALDKLPDKAQQIFRMSCLEGIKYKDIAENLGVSVNTIKSQRARAVRLLKEILKDQVIWVFLLSLLK